MPPEDEARFFRLARAGFSQKRKQLANTFSPDLQLPKQEVIERLRAAGVEPSRRAETLSLEEWARVERAFGTTDDKQRTAQSQSSAKDAEGEWRFGSEGETED